MADFYINPTGPGSPDSIILRIDSNDTQTTKELRVNKGSGGTLLLSVNEDGRTTVTGPLTITGSPLHLDRTGGTGNIANFSMSGTIKASITAAGLGDFSTAGVKMYIDTGANPNGVVSASDGDCMLWHNGATGKNEFWACRGGTAWNKATV